MKFEKDRERERERERERKRPQKQTTNDPTICKCYFDLAIIY